MVMGFPQAASAPEGLPAPADLHAALGLREVPRAHERNAHGARLDVRRHRVVHEVRLGHRLQPDRAADAAGARVHAAMRLEHLLAHRADEAGRRIPDGDDEFVRTRLHVVRDVEGERHLPALVRHADLDAVHEDLRAEVRLLEVKQHPLAGLRGRVEAAPVPQRLRRFKQTPHARKRAFDHERHEDLAVPLRGDTRRVLRDRVLPEAVQVRPGVAHHLRTRILPPRIFGRDLLAPRCLHPRRRRIGAARQRGRRRKHHAQSCLHVVLSCLKLKPLNHLTT